MTSEIKKPKKQEKFHIAYLSSYPLVGKMANVPLFPIPRLELDKERQLLEKSLTTAKRAVKVTRETANADNLRTITTLGCRALHYTGHGFKNCLAFEDSGSSLGMMKALDSQTLKGLFAAGGGAQDVKIVFVSACHSEPAGAAFVDAGVPHVIAVSREAVVGDKSAQTFMYHFYLALLVGKTVKASFEIAKEAVKTECLRSDEAKKFLLLPESGNHDVVIFDDVDDGKWKDESDEPIPSAIPALVDTFMGRNIELQELLSIINNDRRRLITISGESGIGKTTLAIGAAHYVQQRRLFEGVFFVRLQDLEDNTSETIPSIISRRLKFNPIYNTNGDLFRAIGERHYLLIMDGAELLLNEEVGTIFCLRTFINDLLSHCPRIKVLLTSRENVNNGKSRVTVSEYTVKRLDPLSPIDAATLFYELAPRKIEFDEFGCSDPQTAGHKLSQHEALKLLGGHPQKIFDAAQLLSGAKTMNDLPALIKEQEEKFPQRKTEPIRRLKKKQSFTTDKEQNTTLTSTSQTTRMVRELSCEEKLSKLNQDARIVWKQMAGDEDYTIWEKCEYVLNHHFTSACQFQENDRKMEPTDMEVVRKKLVKVIHHKEYVTIDNFEKFWPWFEQLEQAICMIKPMWLTLKPRIIYGLISRGRANELLHDRPVGTFLIRLSESQSGCFAVDFVDDNNTKGHVLISAQQAKFTLYLQEGPVPFHTFPELMMKCRKFMLLYPDVSKNDVFSSEQDEPS